jgi:integrase-like protein
VTDTFAWAAGIPGPADMLSGVQMPRMNAIMERWVLTCRRELLDRTLICNQRHLLHLLREFEQFYNSHRPHQGIANARQYKTYPHPSPGRTTTHPSTSAGTSKSGSTQGLGTAQGIRDNGPATPMRAERKYLNPH